MSAPSKEDRDLFSGELELMAGGLLPHYLANEAAPPSPDRGHWLMKGEVQSGVVCWVAGVGKSRTYGYCRKLEGATA